MSAAEELARIYSRIPDAHCRGLCQRACRAVVMGPAEAQAMRAAGVEPTGGTLHEYERSSPVTQQCPALDSGGACTVYEVRPAICRLYASTPEMPCPFGCQPDRGVLRTKTGRRLLHAALSVQPDTIAEGE